MPIPGFGPRYRSPSADGDDPAHDPAHDRSARRRGSSSRPPMDLGTKSVFFGALALVLSWIPVVNIIGLLAGIITIAMSLFVRVPNTAVDVEPNLRRANIALVLGVAALVVFGVSTALLLHNNPVEDY